MENFNTIKLFLRKAKIGKTLIDYVEENIKRINLTRRIFNN